MKLSMIIWDLVSVKAYPYSLCWWLCWFRHKYYLFFFSLYNLFLWCMEVAMIFSVLITKPVTKPDLQKQQYAFRSLLISLVCLAVCFWVILPPVLPRGWLVKHHLAGATYLPVIYGPALLSNTFDLLWILLSTINCLFKVNCCLKYKLSA